MTFRAWKTSNPSNQRTPAGPRSAGYAHPDRGRGEAFTRSTRLVAMASALLLPLAIGLPTVAAQAAVAPVGQGFAVTPSDLAYILKQIKIAEAHVANTNSLTGPCGALVGPGPNQIASPLLSFGLRTVDGSCNNLQPGQGNFGAADQIFPRLTASKYDPAEGVAAGFFGPGSPAVQSSSYTQTSGSVFDTEPRTISNLIVDQTSTNPAAVAAAGFPVRTQGGPSKVVPCITEPNDTVSPAIAGVPADCTPKYKTLFIPNVTTDVGLSPPYNSMFTLFGQFFDHGIDQTVKGGSGKVYVPLKADDPLIAGPDHNFATLGDNLPAHLRFMALTRGQNQPGPNGILGDGDDVRETMNTDSPWVDQSQTYSSHPSHQVFLREYVMNTAGQPVSTGKLKGGPAGPTAGGMATWTTTKDQAASLLGLRLTDADVTNIPMILADVYGKFIPGPLRGLPQYMTTSTTTPLVEGNITAPVPVPANVRYFDTPFLTDIAHNADPSPQDFDHNPSTPPTSPTPDLDNTASADFAKQPAGTYDDEMLNAHFIAGDGRVNENIGLTAIHQVFHSEHDRLVDDIENVLTTDTSASGLAALPEWKSTLGAAGWNGERLFQAARFVTEMEYQHLVFEEFARKVQPAIEPFQPFAFTQTEINPAVKAEFAHAVYRFGHSMLAEDIDRTNENGSKNNITMLKGFLNPPEYTNGGPGVGQLTSEQAAASIVMGMSDQVGSELDEFVTETLRNNLLGLPLDLAAINMTRARSEGVPALNVFRRQLYSSTADAQLKPYTSWVDFGENIKHPESLINFVAAYGQHPNITGASTVATKRAAATAIVNPAVGAPLVPGAADFMASTGAWANDVTTASSKTGLDKIDLWVGGLAEKTSLFGGLLGSTFNYVFENQLTDLQNSDRLYYLARTPGMNLRTQLEGNSFAELIMRNTSAHTLKADVFATADCKFQLGNLAGTGASVNDDPASECNETLLLIRKPDGTIQYKEFNSIDPPGINGQSVYNGTPGVDRIWGGNDNDTFWGGLGNDVIEGAGGADIALGGEGDDIITDFAGDDIPKGGPGNDAIDAGPGLDIIMGGEGKDFTDGGANANVTFAGAGDDFIKMGQGQDEAFGDSGDDWEEGGNMPDLMQGDSGNLFFLDDSQKPGSDILIGQGNDDDYDMEGGDDIGVAGPGIEKVAGGSGFDWEIGQGDPQPQDADLALKILPLGILDAGVRDKFNEAEALSGWDLNDTLRGDDLVPSAVGGAGFIGCDVLDQKGLDRIAGLDALVPPLTTPLASVVALSASKDCPILEGPVWGAGNILLGGGGSDLIQGNGADDIIDGDKYLSVRLSVRTDPANPLTEIGSAGVEGPGQSAMNSPYLPGNPTTLQAAVFAGTVNPGNIVAVREVLTGVGGVDTAVFSGNQNDYTCTVEGQPAGACDVTSTGATTTVAHIGGVVVGGGGGGGGGVGGGLNDGTDTIRNIERLQFADTVLPVAPTAVSATAGNASATVNWTEPRGLVGSLQVQVTKAGVLVPALLPAVTGAGTLNVTGLTNGIEYTFQVRATNAIGTGPWSAASNVVTPMTVPGSPTAVTATAGISSATVTWTAPTNNGGSPITGFLVHVVNATTGAALGSPRPAPVGATSLVVTGLANGTPVWIDVSATNAAGASIPGQLIGTVTPTAAATVPSAARIGTATAGNASALVRWTAPANGGSAITGYSVRVVNNANLMIGALRPAAAGATSLNVTGLANRTSYRFLVRATNAVGTGAWSGSSNTVTPMATLTQMKVPSAPRIGKATAGVRGGRITATARWTTPKFTGGSAVNGYVVTAVRVNAKGKAVWQTSSRVLTHGVRSLTMTLPKGNYRFFVRARNRVGLSPQSARSNAVTAR